MWNHRVGWSHLYAAYDLVELTDKEVRENRFSKASGSISAVDSYRCVRLKYQWRIELELQIVPDKRDSAEILAHNFLKILYVYHFFIVHNV